MKNCLNLLEVKEGLKFCVRGKARDGGHLCFSRDSVLNRTFGMIFDLRETRDHACSRAPKIIKNASVVFSGAPKACKPLHISEHFKQKTTKAPGRTCHNPDTSERYFM